MTEDAAPAQPASAPPPPPEPPTPARDFEHFTCATGHLHAERTLRLIEIVQAGDLDTIEMIDRLVDRAGPAAAREWLAHQSALPF